MLDVKLSNQAADLVSDCMSVGKHGLWVFQPYCIIYS